MPDAKAQLSSASLSKQHGGTVEYFVSGIDATDPIAYAVQAVTAGGLPQEGDSYGEFGNVQSVSLSQSFPQHAVVTISVGRTGDDGSTDSGSLNEENVVFDAYTAQISTQLDLDGNPIMVIYNPDEPNDKGDVVSNETGEDGQTAEVSAFEAVRTLSISRFESDAMKSIERQRSLVNHTNDSPFAGFDAEAWLCTRCNVPLKLVNGTLQVPFFVSYEFQATENGWQRTARYVNPETGAMPTKNVPKFPLAGNLPRVRLTPGQPFPSQQRKNGYTIVRVQGTTDFNQLNFPLGL